MSWFIERAPWSRWFPGHGATIAGSVLAATLLTWPLAAHCSDHILAAIYHWDAYTNAMIMGGRVDAAIGRGPLSLYDNYFFAPLPNTIAFNENLFGLSLLFAPFYLLSGDPLWSYNLTLLSSMALSVLFTSLLVQRLTNSRLTAFLAGIAFAFCPYVMFEIGRIQLVATQWIPACFLFLHRAMENRRLRDVVGLWVVYLLQIGTCLYYAMFLIPLLTAVALALFIRNRPPLRQLVRLAVGAVAAAGVALGMVYPYFASRENFALERTLSFASSYDGKLSFFGNVHATNLTWTNLHHQAEYRGAHEEIAFPGLTIVLLALLAVAVPAGRYARSVGARTTLVRAGTWSIYVFSSAAITLFTHSVLVGLLTLGVLGGLQLRRAQPQTFAPVTVYVGLFVIAVLMFLGLEPLQFRGAPVHGLYYYFHTYFPGFNGIRKVSRQAILTTFTLVIVASFGCRWLLSRTSRPWARNLSFIVLLAAVVAEVRTFPHPLKKVWAEETIPGAYAFLSQLQSDALVATFPQNAGQDLFRGDHGLALHNYLMLHHKHRSLNGQSSWEPTVTNLASRALSQLPDEGARRVLQSIGLRHLLIHGRELGTGHRQLPKELQARPDRYREVYRDESDYVFSLVPDADPSLALAETPALPARAVPVPRHQLTAFASLEQSAVAAAIDGDETTWWSTRRAQAPGQSLDITWSTPRWIVALEIKNPTLQNHVPLSYELSAGQGNDDWRVVGRQEKLRVPHDLIYSPKTFVFRAVLSEPVFADRLRLTVLQPVPAAPFSVQELVVYEERPE